MEIESVFEMIEWFLGVIGIVVLFYKVIEGIVGFAGLLVRVAVDGDSHSNGHSSEDIGITEGMMGDMESGPDFIDF